MDGRTPLPVLLLLVVLVDDHCQEVHHPWRMTMPSGVVGLEMYYHHGRTMGVVVIVVHTVAAVVVVPLHRTGYHTPHRHTGT